MPILNYEIVYPIKMPTCFRDAKYVANVEIMYQSSLHLKLAVPHIFKSTFSYFELNPFYVLYYLLFHLFTVNFCNAGGLVWVSEWNSLQHPVAAAFLATLYSDFMLTTRTPKITCSGKSFTPSDIRKFARSQVCFPFC